MNPVVALVCFPVIFLGELPDKTMLTSLLLASNAKPSKVWLGAAAAFTVHVAVAVSLGVALFELVPRRVVDAVVAAMFLVGALYAWRTARRPAESAGAEAVSARSMVLTAFIVTFAAEWGDLTQVLTANLAARFRSPLSVAVGALLALWAVAALAVLAGRHLLGRVSISLVRRVTAAVLVALACYTAFTAID